MYNIIFLKTNIQDFILNQQKFYEFIDNKFKTEDIVTYKKGVQYYCSFNKKPTLKVPGLSPGP